MSFTDSTIYNKFDLRSVAARVGRKCSSVDGDDSSISVLTSPTTQEKEETAHVLLTSSAICWNTERFRVELILERSLVLVVRSGTGHCKKRRRQCGVEGEKLRTPKAQKRMKGCSLSEGKTPGAVSVDEGSQHCVTRRQKAIKRTNGVDSDTEF